MMGAVTKIDSHRGEVSSHSPLPETQSEPTGKKLKVELVVPPLQDLVVKASKLRQLDGSAVGLKPRGKPTDISDDDIKTAELQK